ncbi:disease resistance protein At4g27190-like [Magnolia sinica]|uniref:disease resistance protein At4g27190-like n=1 Tax=Magnolia sinica TaxID=86752 RepID=UPI00265B3685|nr:disease resistance protein At4g27190-like [Magnolia sinica]
MEGLIDNVENLEDASNKGHAIIERINEACLLEDNSEELWQSSGMYVKMHDLIRDLAIWITSPRSHEESKFLVRVRAELKVPPREEMWEEMQRISLMWNQIEELPIRPNCPMLVSLSLKNNLELKIIPSSFFELMPKLQILDLSYTAIQSLPMSLSLLVNLHALILKHYRSLVVLPPFGELKELEFIDLSYSAISNLPTGFGNLVKLKKLNLSSLDWLRRIAHNVISRLLNLEDLRLLKTCVNWASDAVSQEVSSATLGEAATLKRLTTFKITIPDIDCLEHDVFHRCWPSLRKFTFYIGSDNWFSDKLCCEKSVQIYGCDHFPHGSKVMIEHAEALGFEKCSGLTRVSQVAGNSKNLRQLHIHDFTGMNCVIDWRDVGDGALQRLEMLYLDQLLNLKTPFEGAVPQRSLQNLRSIEVSICGKLRCLFSSSVIEHLELLEELKVRSCYEMEEIVEGDMLPDNAFPGLRELRLERLYNLTRIISSTASAFMSLQKMEVYRCPLLKKLPFCTSIQMIKGQSEWWDAMEWEDEHNKYAKSSDLQVRHLQLHMFLQVRDFFAGAFAVYLEPWHLLESETFGQEIIQQTGITFESQFQ